MKDRSYGVIPVYFENGSFKILTIQHYAGHWSFPKGHKENSETDIETALRELKEETGITSCELIPDKRYDEKFIFRIDGKLVRKKVTYFIGIVKSQEVTIQQKEIKTYKWCDKDEIVNHLTYKRSKEIAANVIKLLEKF